MEFTDLQTKTAQERQEYVPVRKYFFKTRTLLRTYLLSLDSDTTNTISIRKLINVLDKPLNTLAWILRRKGVASTLFEYSGGNSLPLPMLQFVLVFVPILTLSLFFYLSDTNTVHT